MTSILRIEIILLAAGGSTRLGRPKQLLPYKGSTLLRHLARQAVASDATHVRVVVGAHQADIEEQLRGLHVSIVPNEHWATGLSSSIQAGLDTVSPDADGVILMLCDMPGVTTAHLNALIETRRIRRTAIIASRYGDTSGVPVLFMRPCFPDLYELSGDTGAKPVLRARHDDVTHIDLPGGELDIDTQEDLNNFLPT